MMNSNPLKGHPSSEEIIDNYINTLNTKIPPTDYPDTEDYRATKDEEELQSLAKAIKYMDCEPSEDFVTSLWQKLEPLTKDSKDTSSNDVSNKFEFSSATAEEKAFNSTQLKRALNPRKKPQKILPWIGLVASIMVFLLVFSPWSGSNQNIVLAMEESVKQLQNYHGILEKTSTNEAGDLNVVMRLEIWSDGEKYATKNQAGLLTVNNGETRWSIDPTAKEVSLLPIYLDPHDFDLQKEAAKALRYPHQILGETTIAGRAATHIEVQPPGGLPYSLWIDQQTHLPIQIQTSMQKSLQTTYTYVSLETNTTLPSELFHYNPPQNYKLVDHNQDKLVSSLGEALKVSGITPLQLSETPQRIFASRGRVVFDFGESIVVQTKAVTPFLPDPLAALGQAEGGILEILPDSLRWQQNDLEILIKGERLEELAKQISHNLNFRPEVGAIPSQNVIPVAYDLEVVKNNQQQVDAGSSPWQLDPTQVAFTFVSLKISPEGIIGEPSLDYNALQLTVNDGKKAVVKVSEGPVQTVYLERLLRQDETGIWTVTGYAPR